MALTKSNLSDCAQRLLSAYIFGGGRMGSGELPAFGVICSVQGESRGETTMRKMCLFLSILFLGAAFCAGACWAQVPGDANSDEVVDIGDVVYDLNYVFKGGPPPELFECGDANADCAIDIGDVVYLINYLFRDGPDPGIVECG